MRNRLIVCLSLLASVTTTAQSPTVGPGDIRCPGCALTGQKAAAAAPVAERTAFVANPVSVFFEGRALRFNVIARVVQTSPLVLEMLDSVDQSLDRNMKVIAQDQSGGTDPAMCGGPQPVEAVDLASKPIVSSLRFNDIVTGSVIWNRDARRPDSPLDASPVLTNVRKAAAPVPLFHRAPVQAPCTNRSGRLIVYEGPVDGELTEVYDDGAIHHRNAAYLTFTRERLDAAELSALMTLFRDVNFDALPAAVPHPDRTTRPTIALVAARYQNVAAPAGDARLAPLLQRLDELAARAMSHSQYVVKRGDGVPLTILKWPYPELGLDRFSDTRTRYAKDAPETWRAQVAPDLLAKLPESNAPNGIDNDPNRLVYFSDGGKLYRVGRQVQCAAGKACMFRDLDAAEVAEPAFGECTPGPFNCQVTVYPDGRRVGRKVDPNLTGLSGRLWPRDSAVKLAGVPADGAVISRDEYEKHKEVFFPLLRFRNLGSPFIENGVLYRKVRICQVEPGAPDTCPDAVTER